MFKAGDFVICVGNFILIDKGSIYKVSRTYDDHFYIDGLLYPMRSFILATDLNKALQ